MKKYIFFSFFEIILLGFLFIFIFDYVTMTKTIENRDISSFISLVLCLGFSIKRVSSCITENVLKKFFVLKKVDCLEFLNASEKSKRIQFFSILEKIYRTIVTLFFFSLVAIILKFLFFGTNLSCVLKAFILLNLLFVAIFLYKKQNKIVYKNIKAFK